MTRWMLGTVLYCLVFTSPISGFDSTPLWQKALSGKISAYPAQGLDGSIYIIADDRALYSLHPLTGDLQWIYRPGGRLLNSLLVAPDGTIYIQNDRQELIAVTPGGTGRWKLLMKSDAAALPAAAPDGRLILPLSNGRIICVSRFGVILWTIDVTVDSSAAPVVDLSGNFWLPLLDGRILGVNIWGEIFRELTDAGSVSLLALDSSGRLWAGGTSGSLIVYTADRLLQFRIPSRGERVSAIFNDTNNQGHVYYRDGILLKLDTDGTILSQKQLKVSGGAPSKSESGSFFLPSLDGSIHVLEADGGELILRGKSIFAEPLITEEGILVAGGSDWIVHAWDTDSAPGSGWSQFRGNSRRSGTFPAEPIVYDRKEARMIPGFAIRERMALSKDVTECLALLEELEAFESEYEMLRKLPWVGLLIRDLAASGTIDHVVGTESSMTSYGLVRERAYQLLGKSHDFRARFFLQQCLWQESDPHALGIGIQELGRLGTDWDGSSLRLIAEKYKSVPPGDNQLTIKTVLALVELIRYNGKIVDSAGYSLIEDLINNTENKATRNKVINIIRETTGLQKR